MIRSLANQRFDLAEEGDSDEEKDEIELGLTKLKTEITRAPGGAAKAVNMHGVTATDATAAAAGGSSKDAKVVVQAKTTFFGKLMFWKQASKAKAVVPATRHRLKRSVFRGVVSKAL